MEREWERISEDMIGQDQGRGCSTVADFLILGRGEELKGHGWLAEERDSEETQTCGPKSSDKSEN
ncbi:hypothetical protein [Thermosulfurimonas sp.]|uniref:hypothetical protein n=1 Tax=Thermosulfurimonas sp. TaxID=2080236 RepID=UPI0025FDA112|nr:hypothetical protein [Thermosulfurimonas sp.]